MRDVCLRWLFPGLGIALISLAAHGQTIAVLGNNVSITPGDTTPSATDHTDFGEVNFQAGVVDRTFTIRNTGGQLLRITNMGIVQLPGESGPGEFTIPVTPAQALPPATQTTFTVRFNPAVVGPRRALVRILSNGSNAPLFDFAVGGRGTTPAPEITILGNGFEILDGDPVPRTADNTDFGSTDTGSGLVTHSFTVRNDGNHALTLHAIELVGGQFNEFGVTTPAAGTVPAGSQTAFSVTFDPAGLGVRSTTVRVHNDDFDEGTYDFVIQGTGTVVAPQLTLLGSGQTIPAGDESPSLDDGTKFTGVAVNGSSTHTFTIENTGSADLRIDSISVTGGSAAKFTILQPPPGPIAPGGSATFDVRFRPTASGPLPATLRLTSNDPFVSAYEVALLGVGGTFGLTGITPDGQDVILTFTTNPDTTAPGYLYTISTSTNFWTWTNTYAFASPGGTTEQYRVVGGLNGKRRYWRITETAL